MPLFLPGPGPAVLTGRLEQDPAPVVTPDWYWPTVTSRRRLAGLQPHARFGWVPVAQSSPPWQARRAPSRLVAAARARQYPPVPAQTVVVPLNPDISWSTIRPKPRFGAVGRGKRWNVPAQQATPIDLPRRRTRIPAPARSHRWNVTPQQAILVAAAAKRSIRVGSRRGRRWETPAQQIVVIAPAFVTPFIRSKPRFGAVTRGRRWQTVPAQIIVPPPVLIPAFTRPNLRRALRQPKGRVYDFWIVIATPSGTIVIPDVGSTGPPKPLLGYFIWRPS